MSIKISDSSKFIKELLKEQPQIGIILGSGLGPLANEIEDKVVIPYKQIPHFPVSTVAGHAGELVVGKLEGKTVLAMNGRFHYYEGYSMQEVTFPIRVMKALGINNLIVTNACGGMNPDFYAGALMFIEDHINFMGSNPLIGRNLDELGPRFPDLARSYSEKLLKLGKQVAKKLELDVKSGVYCAISGPGYCTKAELRMLRQWGADTLGMSTVPEVTVAAHMGMEVLGIACITDMAIPESLEPLEHEMVVRMAEQARPKFINLVKGIIRDMDLTIE